MKKYILLSFFIATLNIVYAQMHDSTMCKIYFDEVGKTISYDSAINLFEKELSIADSIKTHRIKDFLSGFYVHQKLYNKAKAIHFEILKSNCKASSLYSPKRRACLDLSEIYFKEKKYKECLMYLRLANDSFPIIRGCMVASNYQIVEYKALLYQCFNAMKLYDSAINYIGYGGEHSFFYSLDEKLSNEYCKTLRKVYTKKEIKRCIKQAIDSVKYEIYAEPMLSNIKSKDENINLKCTVKLFDKEITYIENNIVKISQDSLYKYAQDFTRDCLSNSFVLKRFFK